MEEFKVNDESQPVEEPKRNYDYEDILEMLGGYKYFSNEQCKYIYHKLRGDEAESNYYLTHCMEEVNKINELHNKLKTPQQIKALNLLNGIVDEVNDDIKEETNDKEIII